MAANCTPRKTSGKMRRMRKAKGCNSACLGVEQFDPSLWTALGKSRSSKGSSSKTLKAAIRKLKVVGFS